MSFHGHYRVVGTGVVEIAPPEPRRFFPGERVVHNRYGKCVVITAPHPHPPDYQAHCVCLLCADGVKRCLLHKDLAPETAARAACSAAYHRIRAKKRTKE